MSRAQFRVMQSRKPVFLWLFASNCILFITEFTACYMLAVLHHLSVIQLLRRFFSTDFIASTLTIMSSAAAVMHANVSNSLHAMSGKTGRSGLMCTDVQRLQTSGHIFLDIHGIFLRKAKTQALQPSVQPVGPIWETVRVWDETKSRRLGACVHKRMFQQNSRKWKYLLPSSHCFSWQGRIRAAHTGSLKHQQCRHDNFRKERKPQWSRGEIRGRAGVDCVCAFLYTPGTVN